MFARTYTLTYDTVTPESAEDGDYTDSGFGDGSSLNTTSMETIDAAGPHGAPAWHAALDAARAAATEPIEPDGYDLAEHDGDESAAAVALMVGLLRRHYGATEPSSCPWSPGTWYTTPDGATDYRTGEVTRVSVHLDGWTDAEERAIYDAVTARL
jgi:hypothetical protein